MSKKRSRAVFEIFGFSFLDVICCGFGAVLLLLIITRTDGEPETSSTEPVDQVTSLQQVFFKLNSEKNAKLGEQEALANELEVREEEIARKQAELDAIQKSLETAQDTFDLLKTAADQVATARMTFDRRIVEISPEKRKEVGGIPVDSDYVVFVIDTSGSMQGIWSKVRTELDNILNIHPRVKGIQIMNDMGEYMFEERGNRWLPDTKAIRKSIQRQLAGWRAYSNSSPVEGIQKAIADFYDPSRTISIYVLGDEFNGTSTEAVLEAIRKVNSKDASGAKKVRIHGIGFNSMRTPSVWNYAKLMRQVAQENGGTFLALE